MKRRKRKIAVDIRHISAGDDSQHSRGLIAFPHASIFAVPIVEVSSTGAMSVDNINWFIALVRAIFVGFHNDGSTAPAAMRWFMQE
ncbi:hypothetical protein PM082_018948 [Marasmius tenuissimus]|nr:hypothetical protein PM082_018948 [Marasmius tenuissimus]